MTKNLVRLLLPAHVCCARTAGVSGQWPVVSGAARVMRVSADANVEETESEIGDREFEI